MIQLPILGKKATLAAIAEHCLADLNDAISINDSEAIVLLDAEVVRSILDRAGPKDQRIDDVILRQVL